MPTKFPGLQERIEKSGRKRYFIEIPTKFLDWLGWKGEKMDFSPSLADNDKSMFTVMNLELYKKANPVLSLISWQERTLKKFYKGARGVSKRRKEHLLALSEENQQEQLEEDAQMGNIPKGSGIFRSPEDGKLKLYPKLLIPVEEIIMGRERRRKYLRLELKEISKEIKRLKRLKVKEIPMPSPPEFKMNGVEA